MPNSTYGIVEGGSLTVACDSDSAVYYVWKKEGEQVEDDSIADLMAVDGTLTISNANRSFHSGNYRCIILEQDSTELMASFTVSVYRESLSLSLLSLELKVLGVSEREKRGKVEEGRERMELTVDSAGSLQIEWCYSTITKW